MKNLKCVTIGKEMKPVMWHCFIGPTQVVHKKRWQATTVGHPTVQ